MFGLFKSDKPSVGSILFRGTMPGRPEEFEYLAGHGIEIRPGKPSDGLQWSLRLSHPQWGAAEIAAFKKQATPSAPLVQMSSGLTNDERAAIAGAGHGIALRCAAARKTVLRDRKNFLRFAGAVMGEDGLAVVDHVSARFWSPRGLRDELSHDADLDIEGVFTIHAVSDDGENRTWAHTHGLAELGAYDFDILRPPVEFPADIWRALAFAIAEGNLPRDAARFELAQPGGKIRMVPVERFNKEAPPAWTALRDTHDPGHNTNRSVVCEPAGRVSGMFRSGAIPSRFLSSPIDENAVFAFSSAATDLMADRARNTVGVFASLFEEFRDIELPCAVKIGYVVDGGGPTDREHLWFQVHTIEEGGAAVDATLLNSPFHVAHLRAGERGRHSLEGLSDWAIMTPAGAITPRALGPARTVRENRDEIKAAVAQTEKE
ncbi:MAG: DUF4026 domain-containing protein [Phycisphaerales bacterium]|nr:DUF4026 domain-containing protein [Phycisphaerales bacterium]